MRVVKVFGHGMSLFKYDLRSIRRSLRRRKFYFRFFRMTAIQHHSPAYYLSHVRALDLLGEDFAALASAGRRRFLDLDLEKLASIEGRFDSLYRSRGYTFLADIYERLQRMRERFQFHSLFGGQCSHRRKDYLISSVDVHLDRLIEGRLYSMIVAAVFGCTQDDSDSIEAGRFSDA